MSGLFLSYDWSGGEAEFDDGTNPPETFAYNTEVGLPTATWYQVATALVAWLNAGGRAWSGSITTTMSVDTTVAGAGLGIDLAFSGGTFDFAGTGALELNASGWDDDSGLSELLGGRAAGTVAGAWRMSHWWGDLAQAGAAGLRGSWAMSGGGTLADQVRPMVEGVLTEAQAARFAEQERTAGSPRLAHVWDSINETWRLVALGRVRRRRVGTSHQRVMLEVAG